MIILLVIVAVTVVLPLLALALLALLLVGIWSVVRGGAVSLRVRRAEQLLAVAADSPVAT